MESRKNLHERLKTELKKSANNLELDKKHLKEAEEKLFLLREKLYNLRIREGKRYYKETLGFEVDKIENSLLELANQIIKK